MLPRRDRARRSGGRAVLVREAGRRTSRRQDRAGAEPGHGDGGGGAVNDVYRVLPAGTGAAPELVRRAGSGATWATTVAGPGRPGRRQPRPDDHRAARCPRAARLHQLVGAGVRATVHLVADEPVIWEVTSGRSSNGALPWLALETDDGRRRGHRPLERQLAVRRSPPDRRGIADRGRTPSRRSAGDPGRRTKQLRLPEVSVAVGRAAADAAAALAAPARRAGATVGGRPADGVEPLVAVRGRRDRRGHLPGRGGGRSRTWDSRWRSSTQAGSAGPTPSSDWVAERGDWHRVNTARFPHGLAWLAAETRPARHRVRHLDRGRGQSARVRRSRRERPEIAGPRRTTAARLRLPGLPRRP